MGSGQWLPGQLSAPPENLSSESTNTIHKLHSPQDFKALVAQTFHKHLTSLYRLGARRFLIVGVGSLGCIPKELSKTKDWECADQINGLIQCLNHEVLYLLDVLNRDPLFQGTTFLYAKFYEKVYDILNKPREYGFRDTFFLGCLSPDTSSPPHSG